MADNIDKLFESIESDILSPDIKLQLGILYEQSLNESIKAKEVEMEKTASTELAAFKKTLAEQTDSFLTYFAEDFTKKNIVPIEDSVKVKISEKIIKTFRSLMEEFNMEMSEKKVDNEDALKEAKKECNALTKQLLEARKEIKTHQKAAVIVEHASSLTTDVQKSKLADYAKDIPFDNMFEGKIKAFASLMLNESKAFSKVKPIVEQINIVEKNDQPVIIQESKSAVDKYVDSL